MSESIGKTIKPLHLLSQFSGLILFSVDMKTFEVSCSKQNFFFIVFHVAFVAYLNFTYWTTLFDFSVHTSEIVKTYFPTVAYFNFVVFALAKAWSFYHRKSYGRFMQLAVEIDAELSELGFIIDNKRNKAFIWKIIIYINGIHTFLILACLVSQKFHEMGISNFVFVFIAYGFTSDHILMSQFVTVVCITNDRIKAVYEMIRFQRSILQSHSAMKRVSKIHLKLVDMAAIINSKFSPLMMYSFGVGFSMFCIFIFTLLTFTETFWTEFPVFGFVNVSLNVHLFSVMMILLHVCETSVDATKNIVNMLYQSSIQSNEANVNKQVFVVARQLSELKIRFSCGLFDYDWKLSFKMISAATMYFVILIQLEEMMPKTKSF